MVTIEGRKRNLGTRKFCLECSPFGLHNTRPVLKSKPTVCEICEVQPVRKRSTICGSCAVKVRRHRVKLAAIVYLGGSCKRCGWVGEPSTFDFHHLGGKDFNVGQNVNLSWKRVQAELDKCVLLCAHCHRMEHNQRSPKFLKAVYNYTGELNLGN